MSKKTDDSHKKLMDSLEDYKVGLKRLIKLIEEGPDDDNPNKKWDVEKWEENYGNSNNTTDK